MSEVKERALRTEERNLGWSVYGNSIPYDRIMIGDDLGYEDRAYMDARDMPGWGTGDYYVLRLGEVGYKDATSTAPLYGGDSKRQTRTVFIHELAHVWQSYRGMMPLASSMVNQGCYWLFTFDQVSPYKYKMGKKWCYYNVEQQASIVEDWFLNDMKITDERYPMIRDHVWAGKNHAQNCYHNL